MLSVTANVTDTPDTGLNSRSRIRTRGSVDTKVFTVAVWLLPVLITIEFGAPTVAVALKFTGEPESPPTDAVAVFDPKTPSTRVADAIPLPFVAELDVIEPLPPVTAHVTVTPDTGFAFASVTSTVYGVESVASMVSLCAFPPLSEMMAAAPTVPVALKVTGEPMPDTLALRLFAPAVAPSVQLPTEASPLAFVVGVAPVVEPPPPDTAKVTVIPGVGLPN